MLALNVSLYFGRGGGKKEIERISLRLSEIDMMIPDMMILVGKEWSLKVMKIVGVEGMTH